MLKDELYQLALQTLLNLSADEGIHASGKDEVFDCLFGRDSAITILKILRAHKRHPLSELLPSCRQTLLTLVSLQGKTFNIENGEQPGKFIHEYRPSNYEHLLHGSSPWFVGPDKILRNYDSIDATPLTLIALYKYWQTTQDSEFLITVLPAVEAGLTWIISFGDLDEDFLLEYDFPPTRQFGGLVVQSWTDSHQSLTDQNGQMPKYPIAPIEVQAFAWLALKLWSNFYHDSSYEFSQKLSSYADMMKKSFNKKFILQDNGLHFGAQALDGNKNQIKTITANPLLCLWASYHENGTTHSILDDNLTLDFVSRAFLPDLFVEDAGIRTMSSNSPTFNPNQDCYHNGSFWPILNGLVVEGLENFGFTTQADRLKRASLLPLIHFNCPIELYVKKGDAYLEYCSSCGQLSCHEQAWSAAALLDMAA
ncbi:hypothetical protein HY385_02955 [Candidatus Daviesbacteria bacterium]|nr:hypothetical protein [Candidatus Daviesbacteria bacterium]